MALFLHDSPAAIAFYEPKLRTVVALSYSPAWAIGSEIDINIKE
jgi:hypothetical protein